MRLKIESTDRLGISQEILAVFASLSWDVIAIEVITNFTYVHIKPEHLSITEVEYCLKDINGIISCRPIALLPTQRREKHLQVLLDRIPDPIIDIDENGLILAVNRSAENLLLDGSVITGVEGLVIDQFIEQSFKTLVTNKPTSCSLTIDGQSYIADVSPIFLGEKEGKVGNKKQKISGAVIVLRTMKTLGNQISLLQSQKDQGIESIIGQSSKMKVLIEQTLRYAELDLPVLISGETGTGKELIARALHTASQREKSPFLAINCAAISEHLLESELFGYAPGAFTGAQKGGKPGLFELANGGTIFLDEIAEMSVYLQAKLLRFLQDFKYRRVGGTKELVANVRIISASHQNLTSLLEKKLFREDLFYRLNVLNLDLPPLRDRADDISLLTHYFIDNAARQVNQSTPKITEQALGTLLAYHWPGNIRQLQNILFRVVALDTKLLIEKSDLVTALSQLEKPSLPSDNLLDENIYQMEVDSHNEDWAKLKAKFESQLLNKLYPLYPTTRKLAQRLNVSHNKIAMKLREHKIAN
ncbi:MAG: sigma 54-interacting transcriptional regulator [Colwellia sp.]|nr:sigma 54-interacting transcriptional regulator [Colwellia sp.]